MIRKYMVLKKILYSYIVDSGAVSRGVFTDFLAIFILVIEPFFMHLPTRYNFKISHFLGNFQNIERLENNNIKVKSIVIKLENISV